MTTATAPVRRLGPADLEACLELGADRDWPREEHKWRLLFAVGQVYGIDDPRGGLAAVVVGTPYGDSVTAISMMLVAREHERRGLGRRVLGEALERTGTASALLTATPMGKPLYEAMGFRTVGQCATYGGTLTGVEPSGVSRPFTAADLPAVTDLDTEVFGAPRTGLVAALPGFTSALRVVDSPGGITAFGGAWPNTDTTVLGPVTAPDADTGIALLCDLAAAAPGPVRVDVDHRQPRVLEWVEEHGLAHRFTTAIMVLGPDFPADPARSITPVMLALG
ncbi:GNAT family N-acetyltransferase [Actinokineospora sp. PR83]|uniref:GNAT family N-acetyltransferase n=1 Tax=Actinokineospora sp. PR83 TaxID=2884908 RepID=UPI001F1857D7|nr:GNAT family N-acetyltransferase [Actinokineospora sp. PR83]MCG8915793.1 GNAT family N-acetyltransferase [Actinokineospora sp. PR83]